MTEGTDVAPVSLARIVAEETGATLVERLDPDTPLPAMFSERAGDCELLVAATERSGPRAAGRYRASWRCPRFASFGVVLARPGYQPHGVLRAWALGEHARAHRDADDFHAAMAAANREELAEQREQAGRLGDGTIAEEAGDAR